MGAWTQPCCDRCWIPFSAGARGEVVQPTRLIKAPVERCCFCGGAADNGIYVRVDPKTAPYPTFGDEAA